PAGRRIGSRSTAHRLNTMRALHNLANPPFGDGAPNGAPLPSGRQSPKGSRDPQHGPVVRFLLKWFKIVYAAYEGFLRVAGWAIASRIALARLMSLCPFLICVTALTGFRGTPQLADQVAVLLLEAWPKAVAGTISDQITSVLTNSHGGLLTIGVALAIFF